MPRRVAKPFTDTPHPNDLHRFFQGFTRQAPPVGAPVDGECWVWIGCKDRKGYPKFKAGGRTQYVHRWAAQVFNEPFRRGHEAHHECGNPSCVNPDHLQPLTKKQNGGTQKWARPEFAEVA